MYCRKDGDLVSFWTLTYAPSTSFCTIVIIDSTSPSRPPTPPGQPGLSPPPLISVQHPAPIQPVYPPSTRRRTRAELEQDDDQSYPTPTITSNLLLTTAATPSTTTVTSESTPDPADTRARKRQRTYGQDSDQVLSSDMKLPDSDANSMIEQDAGPSTTNGHAQNNAPTNGFTNGYGKQQQPSPTPSTSIAKVSLPGKMLHDHSAISREEFVRLVIQSLRDVGYM